MPPATSQLIEHRRLFPALANKSYMNFGGQGPLPQESLEALNRSYQHAQEFGPFSRSIWFWMQEEFAKTRAAFAEQLGVAPADLAITQNTSEGCNIAMWGYHWQPGDHLLLSDSEHSSIVATAQQIAKRMGVELTYCSFDDVEPGKEADLVASHLRPRTRLVALSHVLWNTGQTLPVEEIASACRSKSVPLLVDGAQSAGVFPLNIADSQIDYYAVTGHKWMCGPDGIAAFYVRPERLAELEPTFAGWRGTALDDHGLPNGWQAGAGRYEGATAPIPLLSAFRTSVAIHDRFAPARERWDCILSNATTLRNKLSAIPGVTCLGAKQESGLVAFSLPGGNHGKAVEWLERKNIILRSVGKPACLRASTHYFTSPDEIDGLVAAIEEFCHQS